MIQIQPDYDVVVIQHKWDSFGDEEEESVDPFETAIAIQNEIKFQGEQGWRLEGQSELAGKATLLTFSKIDYSKMPLLVPTKNGLEWVNPPKDENV